MSTAETPEVLWQCQTLGLKEEGIVIITKLLSEVGSLPARSLYQYLENVNKPVLQATGKNYEEFLQFLNDLDTVLIDDTDRNIVRECVPSLPAEVVQTEVIIDEVSQSEILSIKNEGVDLLTNIISELGPLPARSLFQYLKNINKPVFEAVGLNYENFCEFLNEGDNFSIEDTDLQVVRVRKEKVDFSFDSSQLKASESQFVSFSNIYEAIPHYGNLCKKCTEFSTNSFNRKLAEDHGVNILKSVLRLHGSLKIKHLIGHLSNVDAAVRKAVGKNDTELLQFLQKCKHFVIKGTDHTVHINNEIFKLKESSRLECIIVEEDNKTELGNMDIDNQSTTPTDHMEIPPLVDSDDSSNLVTQQKLDDFNTTSCSSLIRNHPQKTEKSIEISNCDDLKICSEGDCVCIDVCACRRTFPCESPAVEPVTIYTDITMKPSNADQIVSNVLSNNLCSDERNNPSEVIDESFIDMPLYSCVFTIMSVTDYNLLASNTTNINIKSDNGACATNNTSNSNVSQIVRAQTATITKIMYGAFAFAKFDNHETVYIGQSVLNASLKSSAARDIDRHYVGARVCINACRGKATDKCKWRATAVSLNSGTSTYVNAQQSESTVTETNTVITTSEKCEAPTLAPDGKDFSLSITNDVSGLHLKENTVSQVTKSIELECPPINQSDDEKDRLLSRSQNEIDEINPAEDIIKKCRVDAILIESENIINSDCLEKCAVTLCDNLHIDKDSDEKIASKNVLCGLQSSAFHNATPLKLSSHSPAIQRGLKVIKKALAKRGPLPVKNLCGYFSFEDKEVRDLVGNNETKLLTFLSGNDNFLVEGPDHIVRENIKQPQLLLQKESKIKDAVSNVKIVALTSELNTEIPTSSELNSCETNVSIDVLMENRYNDESLEHRFNDESLEHNLPDIVTSFSFVEQSCLTENKTRIAEDTRYSSHLNNDCSISGEANSRISILDNCCAKEKNLHVTDEVNCCSKNLDACNNCSECTDIESNVFYAESDDRNLVPELMVTTFDQYICHEPSVPQSCICDQNHYSETSQDRCELLRESSNVKQTIKTIKSLEPNYSETLPDNQTIRKKFKCLEAIKSITRDKDRKTFPDKTVSKLCNNLKGPFSEPTSAVSNLSETNENIDRQSCNHNFSASNQPCVISATMNSISNIVELPSTSNISLDKSFGGKELLSDNEMNILEPIDSSNGLVEQVNAKQVGALSFVNDFELDEEIYFSLSSSNSDSIDDELISVETVDTTAEELDPCTIINNFSTSDVSE